jgi:Spy/CpxP family protein refolding chaperone
MSPSNLTKTLRTLGLAAALLGSAFAQGASARTVWTVDGPMEVQQTSHVNTLPQDDANETPAQRFLEESGATGGNGQHS